MPSFILIIQFMHEYIVTGFNADDGASLLMTFRGLQAESVNQGQAHNSIAKELTTLVVDPFDYWAQAYKVKIYLSSLHVLIRSITGASKSDQSCRH